MYVYTYPRIKKRTVTSIKINFDDRSRDGSTKKVYEHGYCVAGIFVWC